MDKIVDSLLHPNLSSLVLGLILFFSATQLGFHFWPLSTLVYGIRIDYLSPTLYFLDILLILYLSLSIHLPSTIYHLLPLVPILLTNLLYSHSPLATLSWSLHLILYLLFLATLRSNPRGSQKITIKPRGLQVALTLSLLFQTILASLQVYLGHSLGGFLYYLGERSVAVGSPNIALGSFMGHVVLLRAYGTFGHPNVLAGYAVITLLIILFLSPARSVLKRKTWLQAKLGSAAAERTDLNGTLRLLLPLTLTTLLILLAQSRSALISLFGIIIPFYLLNNFKSRIIYFVIILSTIYALPSTIYPIRSDLSLSQRLNLQGVSLQVISHYPIFGTGAQASISTYPALLQPKPRGVGGLQPDHNSLTLILSWFGLFGALALLYALRILHLPSTIYHLLPLAPLLLLDHYLFTSPQGLFILLLYLRVTINHEPSTKNHCQ